MAKYETGRRCLVLHSDLTGSVIFLGRCIPDGIVINRVPYPGIVWLADPIYRRDDGVAVGWDQKWLLPIDDENLNKELRDELLETKPAQLVPEAS
jgi:hypothetical protein